MTDQARRPPRRPAIAAWLVPALAALSWSVPALAEQVDVAEELERLEGTYGFTVKDKDLDIARGVKGRAEGDALVPRLRLLLEGFDHIIVQRPDGAVDRVLILGVKGNYTPPEPKVSGNESEEESKPPEEGGQQGSANGEIVIQTQRKGASHAVSLTLEGQGGKRVTRVLLLDTGADYLVLPSSILPQLGISPNGLRTQAVQTANGRIEARMGKLPALWLGSKKIEGVETAFIDDNRLGGNSLLGMSVLSRFRVTIDDEHNRLVLADK